MRRQSAPSFFLAMVCKFLLPPAAASSNPRPYRILYSILPLNNPPLCAAISMPSPRLPLRLRRRFKVRDVTESLYLSWRLSTLHISRPDLRLSHIFFSNHRRLLRIGQEGINPRQTRKSPRTNKELSCRAPRVPDTS